MATTDTYEGMIAETTSIVSPDGEYVNAYFARPLGAGPFPGIVLFHHRPGWDEFYKETTRRFAHHGFLAICPDLYHRHGHGEPDDVAARVKAEGDVSDTQVINDGLAAVSFLRSLLVGNGRVGLFGTCSGGRHAFLTACSGKVDAVVNCWGGRVIMSEDELDANHPTSPVDLTSQLSGPMLGLFGADDGSPSPAMVSELEENLRKHRQPYEFHMYPEAGHGFFYYDRPAAYRAGPAVDGWAKIWEFLNKHLTSA